jgi:hypothetical protein
VIFFLWAGKPASTAATDGRRHSEVQKVANPLGAALVLTH